MHALPPARAPAAGGRPSGTVCHLTFSDGCLTAALSGPGPARRLRIKRVNRGTLAELVAWHRAAVTSTTPEPGAGVVSATDRHLQVLYELVSYHLVDLLASLPRVALVLHDPLLARLPLETAHAPDRPALFELTQCYRLPPTGSPGLQGRRRFRLEHLGGDERDLGAVALERALIGDQQWAQAGSPVMHIAGHQPSAPTAPGLDGTAHLVLSGCDSLPLRLPPGVASVVGTLWPVEDQAGVTVMAAYHRRLAAGIGPLEALRQALLLHRPLPPDTWAAYAYLGHPD